jgi:hypothetical protein
MFSSRILKDDMNIKTDLQNSSCEGYFSIVTPSHDGVHLVKNSDLKLKPRSQPNGPRHATG